ncbi:Uncharacterised protein [[Flavobacterium] thermophilum]|nr:hypothetical protein GARCT_00857 [Geobacillus sp. 12AMOR1]STO36148.1 Uncharacterised protein [[Flavobacterium] thermophilum]
MLYYNEYDLQRKLAKLYKEYELTKDELDILNACIIWYDSGEINFDGVSEMTGKPLEEIMFILDKLHQRGKIVFHDSKTIDFARLDQQLYSVELSLRTLWDKLLESSRYKSHSNYLGDVELIPKKDGGISVYCRDGFMWDKKDMLELSERIKKFAESISQEDIDVHNNEITEWKKFKREQYLKQREEKKQRKATPENGLVVIFRIFPSGLYKFSYTTSSSKEHKISELKDQYGNNIEIVHVLETYDTKKFYYQFLKKQFSTRLETYSEYRLTEENIQFIKSEKYPANAMEWLRG